MKRPLLAALAALILLVAGCGDDDDTDSATTTTSTATSTTSSTDDTSTTSTTEAPTSTTGGSTTTALPGEPAELFARDGDELGVVGVRFDDVLNVRAGPGTDQEIVATLDPTGTAVATGRARSLESSFWYEVTADGTTGWANIRFLGFIGRTTDETAAILDDMGGTRPEAATMLELGSMVAESLASEEPPSTITVTVEPTTGDLGEVTYDVVDLGDDSVLGFRLHVFGEPTGGGFTLRTVESTLLCARGATDEGICV